MARAPYGMQIPTLGKVYIKILQLGSECVYLVRRKWKKCNYLIFYFFSAREAEILEARNFNGFRGDYAERVYRILKPRCTHAPSNLTLKEVHDMLDTIANENRLSK